MKIRLMIIATLLLAVCNITRAEDNVTISDFKISAGETKTVSVSLNNDEAYVAFQFDLCLPEGITIESSSLDHNRVPESTTLDMSTISSGVYRFISTAMNAEPLVGNNGTIVTLTVKASTELTHGRKTGYFRKVKLAKSDATGPVYEEMSFSITVLEPSVVTVTSVQREYGEDNPIFEYTVEGGVLEGTPSIICEATPTSPVGKYTIKITKGSITNYNVTLINGTLTVAKAPLMIAAGTYSKKQGEANPEFTLSYEGFKNNETKDVLTKQPSVTCEATSASAPGDYPVTVSGAEAQNYNISYANGKLIVTDADPVKVTAKSYSREYGEANPTFEYVLEGTTLEGTPEIICEATETSPVGEYPIVIKKGSVTNYNDMYVNGVLTITKAPLTISVGNYEKKQYDPMPEFSVFFDGFKNNETEEVLAKQPVISCEANEDSTPGEYAITVSGAEAENYEIQYIAGKLTVTEPDSYTLTYMVDGEVYQSYSIKYRDQITPLEAPEKEGYTFSGWSVIPETMPANDVVVTGAFTVNSYTLTYMVDGEVYKTSSVPYGSKITPEADPAKEGYTFSGWSEIPETMPAKDVTVTGTFSVNSYTLTYIVDGEVYKTSNVPYGSKITPEAEPSKEGYTFSGWSEIPETMPAKDVVVIGTFSVNSYTLTYMVDGEVYQSFTIKYRDQITPLEAPTKEGYTFSGWDGLPRSMPAKDVIVKGYYTINSYTVTYVLDGEVYTTETLEYGAKIVPPVIPGLEDYSIWEDVPETVPAKDITIYGKAKEIIDSLGSILNSQFIIHNEEVYDLSGRKLDSSFKRKGINIIRMSDGTIRKVLIK